MGEASLWWLVPATTERRYWRGLARGGGAPRGRHWNLRKDLLIRGLQFGDLAHHHWRETFWIGRGVGRGAR